MKEEEEILEIVDADDRVIGTSRRGEIHRKGLWHRSACMLVFNSRGELFIQRRGFSKDIFPGRYGFSAGGHVDPGETYQDTALRELEEELGIRAVEVEEIKKFCPCGENNWEFCTVFRVFYDGSIQLSPGEVSGGKFCSRGEIERKLEEERDSISPDFLMVFGWCGENEVFPDSFLSPPAG